MIPQNDKTKDTKRQRELYRKKRESRKERLPPYRVKSSSPPRGSPGESHIPRSMKREK